MLLSVPCPASGRKKVAGCGTDGRGRTLEVVWKDVGPLSEIEDARGVAVFDLDEDVSGLHVRFGRGLC